MAARASNPTPRPRSSAAARSARSARTEHVFIEIIPSERLHAGSHQVRSRRAHQSDINDGSSSVSGGDDDLHAAEPMKQCRRPAEPWTTQLGFCSDQIAKLSI